MAGYDLRAACRAVWLWLRIILKQAESGGDSDHPIPSSSLFG